MIVDSFTPARGLRASSIGQVSDYNLYSPRSRFLGSFTSGAMDIFRNVSFGTGAGWWGGTGWSWTAGAGPGALFPFQLSLILVQGPANDFQSGLQLVGPIFQRVVQVKVETGLPRSPVQHYEVTPVQDVRQHIFLRTDETEVDTRCDDEETAANDLSTTKKTTMCASVVLDQPVSSRGNRWTTS